MSCLNSINIAPLCCCLLAYFLHAVVCEDCVTIKVKKPGWYALEYQVLNGRGKGTRDSNATQQVCGEPAESYRCEGLCDRVNKNWSDAHDGSTKRFQRGREVVWHAKAGDKKTLTMSTDGTVNCSGSTYAGFKCEFVKEGPTKEELEKKKKEEEEKKRKEDEEKHKQVQSG